jgi:hypothetical protein
MADNQISAAMLDDRSSSPQFFGSHCLTFWQQILNSLLLGETMAVPRT